MTLTKYPIIVSFARKWPMDGFADNAIDGYTYMLGRVADHLGGETALITATRDQLEEYLIGRRSEVSPSAIAFDVRAIRAFYNYLVDEGEITINPAAKIKHPKVDEPTSTGSDAAGPQEAVGHLRQDDHARPARRRDSRAARLGGLRRSELCVLDLDDADLDHRSVSIPKTKVGRPRSVPLHPDAIALLDRWLRSRGSDPGPLFTTRTGRRMTPNAVGMMFTKRTKQVGLDGLGTHAFRRGLAIRWLSEGGSEASLKAMAGWTSTRMVSTYTRMAAEHIAHDEYRRIIG